MEFKIHRKSGPPSPWLLFVPGSVCILLGTLIMLMPQLLIMLVSGTLIFGGAVLLSVAWRFKSAGSAPMFSMFRDRFTR